MNYWTLSLKGSNVEAWKKVDLRLVEACNICDLNSFKGLIAEALVYQHLMDLEGAEMLDLMMFPSLDYRIVKKDFGNEIFDKETGLTFSEIDFCFKRDGVHYIVEVKSGKLKRFDSKKVEKQKGLVRKILGVDDVQMVLASHLRPWDNAFFPKLDKLGLHFLDLGYNKPEFHKFAERHYKKLSLN